MPARTRATWWSVTAFGEEIALCEDGDKYPEWIEHVYGGQEICPKSGRLHFQGAVQCRSQVWFSQIKSYFKKAHLEPARSRECLAKYAMKSETSAGEKTVRDNPNAIPYYKLEDVMRLIATQFDYKEIGEKSYWKAVCAVLKEKPFLASQFQNPSNRNFFIKTCEVWRPMAGYSITPASQPASQSGMDGQCAVCGTPCTSNKGLCVSCE